MAPITLKPVVVVFNVDEEGLAADPPAVDLPSFSASAALEAEVGGLGPEESKELLGAYGIDEPVLGRVIDAVYRLLDLITFFTAGDTESRAWEVRRGATAPEAAGVIHSDIQRGFIRAEIIGYDALVAAGSWNNAKSKGVLRLEGKDYKMVEGDSTRGQGIFAWCACAMFLFLSYYLLSTYGFRQVVKPREFRDSEGKLMATV